MFKENYEYSFFKNKKPACVFAGTFDPITNGHIDIVNKAKIDFAKVYVTIMVNPNKTPLFSLEDRLKFLNTIFKNDEQGRAAFDRFLAVCGITE